MEIISNLITYFNNVISNINLAKSTEASSAVGHEGNIPLINLILEGAYAPSKYALVEIQYSHVSALDEKALL